MQGEVLKVLIVATHPDDEVLGCGGVMARYAAAGCHVEVLVITRGIPEIFPESEIESTREELRRAHHLLGVRDVEFLDFPAPKLDSVPKHQLADKIHLVIRRFAPHTVYVPHPGDLHADHKAVYYAALVAARPIDGCSVKRLLCYETLSETEWASPVGGENFVPTMFVDISAQLSTKLDAMNCYKSQLRSAPHPRSLTAIEALARVRGASISVAAAEAFVLVRGIE